MKREIIVRPARGIPEKLIAPMQNKTGDLEANPKEDEWNVVGDKEVQDKSKAEEAETVDTDTRPVWEKMHDQVEDLNVRVARHFEDSNDADEWKVPMVKSPLQPTKEEWLQHQLIHTPYAPWCKHCVAARAARADHKSAK